jgi:CheY-like chemotaxis protein
MSIGEIQALVVVGRVQVLVVENDEVNAQVARTMLERLGCRVDCADDGAAAVESFRKEPFDLILMAWQMPVMDGIEAAARIRSMPRGQITPIICTSSKLSRLECLAAGMSDIMPKPFTLEKLKSVLSKWTIWDESLQTGSGL